MVHHLDSRCVLICAACLFLHASQWKVSELQAPLLKYWLHSSFVLTTVSLYTGLLRDKAAALSIKRAHTAGVTVISAHPTLEHVLASGS